MANTRLTVALCLQQAAIKKHEVDMQTLIGVSKVERAKLTALTSDAKIKQKTVASKRMERENQAADYEVRLPGHGPAITHA